MKFLIDADLPYSLKVIFKKHGHDVLDIFDSVKDLNDVKY